MVFDGFRNKPFPTLYGENRSAVTVDVLEVGLIVAFLAIAFSMLLIIPGVKDWRQGLSIVVRGAGALYVGLVILICNFGYEWQEGTVTSTVQYKQFVNVEVRAKIGLKIGLHGVNITLKATEQGNHADGYGRVDPPKVLIKNMTEEINYNEHFDFGWDQQLNGFGPNAALLNRQFREAQRRGVPLPILAVAEYFTLDGEGIRWGRLYRQAGYYTHLMLWTAFPLWVLTCLLMLSLLVYGAIFLMLTGASLLLSCVIFVGIHTIELELKIPFQQGDLLTLSYGWCFGLALSTGILCMLTGLAIIIAHMLYPIETSTFFGTSLLEPEDIAEVENMDEDFEPVYAEARTNSGFPFQWTNNTTSGPITSKATHAPGAGEGLRVSKRPIIRLSRQVSGASSGSNKIYTSPYRSAHWRRFSVPKRRPRTALYPTMVFQKTEPAGMAPNGIPSEGHESTCTTSQESTIVLYDAVKMGGGRGKSGDLASGRPVHHPPPPPHLRDPVPLQLKGHEYPMTQLTSADSSEPACVSDKPYRTYKDMTNSLTASERRERRPVEPSPTPPSSDDSEHITPQLASDRPMQPYSQVKKNKSPGGNAANDTGSVKQKPQPPPRDLNKPPVSGSPEKAKKALMPKYTATSTEHRSQESES